LAEEQRSHNNSDNADPTNLKQHTDSISPAQSAWDAFVPPPDDKFDWIQLTSGEWLKGELKALYNYDFTIR